MRCEKLGIVKKEKKFLGESAGHTDMRAKTENLWHIFCARKTK